ncbi:caspase family protein [Klebsiella variicola]|uniref:caspase family protein n=1 Tax=Klebsiella variicola TaxID=244366 RepID=UPI0013B3F001|nr:caspase family protein [Klebsiella variicola]
MPLLFDREVIGPKTHAFVIGVGNYPFARAGQGVSAKLRAVPALPSAADSAKLVCNCLIENKDRLAAPLATLDVLISDPPATENRYPWVPAVHVDSATVSNVGTRGFAWYQRLSVQPGDVAFFYCCGHGASHLQQPVVFLEDLNSNPTYLWSHINLGELSYRLRKHQSISAAFLFSDACGEFIPQFELIKQAVPCPFYPDETESMFSVSRNQVSLLCAASENQLAYEGPDLAGSHLKFGRFTQTCLKGLSGSSARYSRGRWGVNSRDLQSDLKALRRIYFEHWGDKEPFDPYSAVTPSDLIPLVYPENFELPLVVSTDPTERMPYYDFAISERNEPAPPWLKNNATRAPGPWKTSVPPSINALYAIAIDGTDYFSQLFQPKEPLFEQWVSVP